MDKTARSPKQRIEKAWISEVVDRLSRNQAVRRSLPLGGRIHVDRKLPFLFVYRKPVERLDEGTEQLLFGEASYVLASGDELLQAGLRELVRRIVEFSLSEFSACLIIELWSGNEAAKNEGPGLRSPGFRIWHRGSKPLLSTVEALERSLNKIRILRTRAKVETAVAGEIGPPRLSPWLAEPAFEASGVHQLGIEVRPVYRSDDGQTLFPVAMRELRREFSRSTKHALVAFVRQNTSSRPAHYQLLGRRRVVKAVWQTDRVLAEIDEKIRFLLFVTPINFQAAWVAFERNGCKDPPRFGYRPLPFAPLGLKRELYSVPIEQVEDPELGWMLRKKQLELDWLLTALASRGAREFLYGSQLVFGDVSQSLLQVACDTLDKVPARSSCASPRAVTATDFAVRAREEIKYFGLQRELGEVGIEIHDEVTGLMVSNGTLFIGSALRVPVRRLEAVLQHEVGTHLLTYLNGQEQRLNLLRSGLSGYDELQEGLAVLSEYLVGGLSPTRLRLLAARVEAVKYMTDGADFVQTFNRLCKDRGFSAQTAFGITTRVFRSGGLTKDAIYLRGLVRILRYLRNGGTMEPLLVGKLGFGDLNVVEELLRRKVLLPASLTPRYLHDPTAQARLGLARRSTDLVNLLAEDQCSRTQ